MLLFIERQDFYDDIAVVALWKIMINLIDIILNNLLFNIL